MLEALEIAEKRYSEEKKKAASVRFLETEYAVSPDGGISSPEAGDIPLKHKVLILHYLLSGPARETGELIDFKGMPGGITYNPVFEGRVYSRLKAVFGGDHKLFKSCGKELGASEAAMGDAALKFEVFPGAALFIILFSGDEEFAPACKILFDSGIKEVFPTEDAIIICEELSRKLSEVSKCQKR